MTATHHELIPLAAPERWAQALSEVPHGHAHTWGFSQAIWQTSSLPTYLYRYSRGETRVVCPISEREYAGRVDVVTPYGFGGFAARGSTEHFASDWVEFARTRNWVCGYIALHPLLQTPGGFAPEEVHTHHRLWVMHLQQTDTELLSRMSHTRRKQLRDPSSIAEGINRDRRELSTFLAANYAEFFARRGAGAATRFKTGTVRAIAALDDVLMIGRGRGGHLEAVTVWGYTQRVAESLFQVSVSGGEIHGVPLVWAGILALRDLGVKSLNLGGGVRADDSIAAFKRRFGASERDLVSLRQVFQPTVYTALCRDAGSAGLDRSGYFPAYRA